MLAKIAIAALSVACLLLLGLNLMTSDFIVGEDHCPYINITYHEVVKRYPGYDARRPMAVREGFGYVIGYYPLPIATSGGSPEVKIQRLTCKVLSVNQSY